MRFTRQATAPICAGLLVVCLLSVAACTGMDGSKRGNSPPPLTIPFETGDTGLPTVTVRVGGAPVQVFLDYGGFAGLALKSAALATTQVTFTGEVQHSRDAQGNERVARKFVAAKVDAGTALFEHVPGTELPASPAFRFPQSGYLGFAVLRHYLAVFDYRGSALRLYPSGDHAAMVRECGDATFPIAVVDGVAQATVHTAGGDRTFQFDTGANQDLVRPSTVPGSPVSPGSTVTLKGFRLGDQPATDRSFLVIPYRAPDVDGVLGYAFFAEHTVCLDPGAGLGGVR